MFAGLAIVRTGNPPARFGIRAYQSRAAGFIVVSDARRGDDAAAEIHLAAQTRRARAEPEMIVRRAAVGAVGRYPTVGAFTPGAGEEIETAQFGAARCARTIRAERSGGGICRGDAVRRVTLAEQDRTGERTGAVWPCARAAHDVDALQVFGRNALQMTHPPNGSLTGTPSSITSARPAPEGAMLRSEMPSVVALALRLEERRNSDTPGTCSAPCRSGRIWRAWLRRAS